MSKSVKLVLFILLIAMLVWSRGNGIAKLVGGRYPARSFLLDVLGFGLLLLFLAGLSFVLRRLSQRLCRGKRWLQLAIYTLAMIVLAFPLLLVTAQLHPIRVEGSNEAYTPANLGLAFENVTIEVDKLKLAGWLMPAAQAQRPIVLVTHGLNAEKANFLYVAKPLHDAGFHVFTFDFRAHGQSEGRTTTFGLNEARDVKAAYDWLTQRYPGQPIYGLGFSMGGAALAHAAVDYGIFERIAFDSTFASFESVAKSARLNLFGPLSSLLWQISRGWAWLWTQRDFAANQPAQRLATQTNRRLLFIHGTADTLIPVSAAHQLATATAPSSDVWLIEGSDHVQSYLQPDYDKRIVAFFSN